MAQWFMLTLVGKDRVGIVARVSTLLFEQGAHLGEASMMRLGGNFTIMLMVRTENDVQTLKMLLQKIANDMDLHIHIENIDGQLHQHKLPNMRISVYGADRMGIVATVTNILVEVGFNILDLESDVGGSQAQPIYIMHIEGYSETPQEEVQKSLDAAVAKDGISTRISHIDTLIG